MLSPKTSDILKRSINHDQSIQEDYIYKAEPEANLDVRQTTA